MTTLSDRESERQLVQDAFDTSKSQLERNRLGQFATPHSLARDIAEYCAQHFAVPDQKRPMTMLEPAVGTGAFWSAWLGAARQDGWHGIGIELDSELAAASRRLWTSTGLRIQCGDFTTQLPPDSDDEKADLIIANPPYVRHHHLERDQKIRLREATARASGIRLSGLAGLYCHFLALAHPWMRSGCVAAWLVPSEFMDVNYGGPLKRYLLDHVTLLRVHQFDPTDVQFDDALVSSAVIVLLNESPPADHEIEFTRGRTLLAPKRIVRKKAHSITHSQRWTQIAQPTSRGESMSSDSALRLGDIFSIRRGLVTGGNEFFVLSEEEAAEHELPADVLTPILPSPRHLTDSEVFARTDGSPDLDIRNFLLDCRLEETDVKLGYPSVWRYLKGAPTSLRNRYICQHRKPWFRQEKRRPAPLLCTYLGRGANGRRPFRFILNHSNATAANVYHLLYPLPGLQAAVEQDESLLRAIWAHLNNVDVAVLTRESRVYGGGLHKLEPRELSQVSLEGIDPDVEKAIRLGGLPALRDTEPNVTHQLLEAKRDSL